MIERLRRLALAFAVVPLMGVLPASAVTVNYDCRACESGTRFYQSRELSLAWTGAANVHLYQDLLQAVRGAASHGLDPADYHLALLEAADPRQADLDLDEVATDAYLTLAAHLLSGRLNPVTIEPDWTAARRGRDLVAYLQAALGNDAVAESLEALAPDQPGYQALRDALARYEGLADEGGWPGINPGLTLHPGDRGPRVAQLRARLEASGDLAPLVQPSDPALPAADPEFFDPALDAAVRAFQHRASLDPDGNVGPQTLAQLNASPNQRIAQIRANLERWRWLPEDLGRRHIRVNIADFSLEARNDGVVEQQHDVIVGRLYRRTPVFSASMTYFVINPWWETPPSLAARDKLPAFRADPGAVTRLGFQVIDRTGTLVDPATIDWATIPATNFPYRLRQSPGPLNALGEVKFMFPNPHNVYLHDTPTRGLFSQTRRDFSSGCVRVRDPLALAEWVAAETPGLTPARLQSIAAGNDETRLSLARAIPVHILYWTAVPDPESGIRFVNDVYDRDSVLIAALDSPPPPME
ncbi:L,D-transpeptidase family protein [Maricaulis sp.]|uniref:L,D-transpeptidase family protein n=1 Tax=Maricaulis sp. TaxID=1486257 RepID=UPI003A92E67F